jgi:transcriptional regulator with XRE-family HTH domain
MQLKISENVKRLRRESGLTQEQLAAAIGISGQTVSKWECGDGYPDITTLPVLASYFGVSVDEILGMDAYLDEKRIDEAKAKTEAAFLAGPLQNREIVELWRELAREFPRNDEVQWICANWLITMHNTVHPEDLTEAVGILERLLEYSSDSERRNQAYALLINALSALGETDRAIALAEKLPDLSQSREATIFELRTNRQDFDDRLPHVREFAAQAANLLIQPLQMLRIFAQNGDRADDAQFLKLTELERSLYELVYYNDPTGLNLPNFHSMLEMLLASFYAPRDAEKTLEHIEKYVDLRLQMPHPHGSGGKSWINTAIDENGRATGDPVWEDSPALTEEQLKRLPFADPAFDPLRDHPRFKAAVARFTEGT